MTVFNLLARWRQIDAFANHLAGLADIGPDIGPIGLITLALSCQGRIQDLKLGGGVKCGLCGRVPRHSHGGAEGMFSFEMVHFDAFWSTFRL